MSRRSSRTTEPGARRESHSSRRDERIHSCRPARRHVPRKHRHSEQHGNRRGVGRRIERKSAAFGSELLVALDECHRPPVPAPAHTEVPIAQAVAQVIGVRHVVIPQGPSRVAAELLALCEMEHEGGDFQTCVHEVVGRWEQERAAAFTDRVMNQSPLSSSRTLSVTQGEAIMRDKRQRDTQTDQRAREAWQFRLKQLMRLPKVHPDLMSALLKMSERPLPTKE